MRTLFTEFDMKIKPTVNHCERVLMPELLAGLTERNAEILLGFKEKTGDVQGVSKVRSVQKPTQSLEPHDDDEEPADLDLTGSPLGADFDPHQKWNLSCPEIEDGSEERINTGPKYSGVSLSQARGWLTDVNNGQECWAVLNGEDKDRTVYLGSRVENDRRIMSRVLSFPQETSKVLSGNLGRVLSLHTSAGAGHRTVKYQARSELNLINSMAGNDSSSIKIVSSWNKVNSLLEFPPADAETRLQVTVVAGDDKLDTKQLWTELQLLSGFVRGLAGEGVTWLGGEDSFDMEVLVEDIIETVRQIGPRSGVTRLESDTLMDHQDMEPFSFKARQEVDFTDILWSNLYKVQSYQELTEAFKMIFTTIVQEEIRPFVYARSKTSVVRLVNSIVRGNETLPDMTGSLPLEMLIECGLEKLQRDYSHTLLNSELASKESIAHFLGADNNDEAVKKLHNLHLVVELAVLMETHTKLSSDILRSIVSTALSSVPVDSMLKRSYEFSVPTQALEMLFIQSPDIWQLKLSTGNIKCASNETFYHNLFVSPDIQDSCLTRGVETTVRIVQHTYNDDNDPEFVMYVNNEVSRSVMK